MDGSGVPLANCGGYSVHAIDPLHEGGRDSSQEEVDEGVFVGDFVKGDMIFELGDVVSKSERFLVTEVVVSHGIALFLTLMWINDVWKLTRKAVQVPSVGTVSVRAFLVKVDAQIVADPSFMKDRAKVILFSLSL